MMCGLQINRDILLNSSYGKTMVGSGRKKKAAKRTQHLALSCSEWLPPFCHVLIALKNSWIDPTRKLLSPSLLVFQCYTSVFPFGWEYFDVSQGKQDPFSALKISGCRLPNQHEETDKEKTISQCWASATPLSGWRPFACVWHQRVAEIADSVVASWYRFTKGLFDPPCTAWILATLNTLKPGSN